MNNHFLYGEKIYLRGMLEEDLNVYGEWIDNPEVTYYMEMGAKPYSAQDKAALYKEATDCNEAVVCVIVEKSTGKPVGTIGLYLIQWICRRAQFRILIGDSQVWDKGYGTEATKLVVKYGYERLNLETIYLGVNEENLRAIRSYEKAGFVHEGRQRRFVYRNGRYYDVVNMSMLREEYFKMENNQN